LDAFSRIKDDFLNLFLGYAQTFFVVVHPRTVSGVAFVSAWFGHDASVVHPGGVIDGVIAAEVAGTEVGAVHGDITGIHGGHQVAVESHHE